MYQIALIPRSDNPNLPSVTLSFKSNEKALRAREEIHHLMAAEKGIIEARDDYGYVTSIRREDILHVLYIDCEQAEIQRLEKNLCLARVSKKLLARVSANAEESQLLASIMKSPQADRQVGMATSPSRIIQ